MCESKIKKEQNRWQKVYYYCVCSIRVRKKTRISISCVKVDDNLVFFSTTNTNTNTTTTTSNTDYFLTSVTPQLAQPRVLRPACTVMGMGMQRSPGMPRRGVGYFMLIGGNGNDIMQCGSCNARRHLTQYGSGKAQVPTGPNWNCQNVNRAAVAKP